MKVKIIKGTYGHHPVNRCHITPVSAGNTVDVSEKEANRLISIGIAKPVEESSISATEMPLRETENVSGVNTMIEQENAQSSENKPNYDTDMNIRDLRKIMDNVGLSYRVGMSKADMVKALDMYFSDDAPVLNPEVPTI